MRVGTSGGLADLQRLRRAGIGEEGTAGFLVEKYRKKGTDPPEQGESPEKVIDMLCLHREKPLCTHINMPLPFPTTDPVPNRQHRPRPSPWSHAPCYFIRSQLHSEPKEEQYIPRQRLK